MTHGGNGKRQRTIHGLRTGGFGANVDPKTAKLKLAEQITASRGRPLMVWRERPLLVWSEQQSTGRVMVLAVGLLVLGGVGVAMAMDAGIVGLTPVLHWLKHLPLALRVIVYVVVGVPVGLGMALYLVLEMADLVGVVSSPFAWLGRLRHRH